MFYSVYLSKNGRVLSWRMSVGIRIALGFALVSVLAMVIWVMASGDYAESSRLGRVNLILVPLVLIIFQFYEDSIVLDRDEGWLETRMGLVFFKRTRRWSADELTAIEYRVVRGSGKISDSGFSGILRTRVFFAFQMKNRLIILDRACRLGKAEIWLRAFQAFWPLSVGVNE